MSGVRIVDVPNKVIVEADSDVVKIVVAGPQGPLGPQGLAATVNVGSTTTLAPGDAATVVNSGTSGAAILDFGIPEGVQGVQGDTGTAATLDVGVTTTVNPDQPPDVTNSGTTAAAIFDFDLPRAAVVSVGSVSTVGPSDPATVSDSGVDGDVVLDFEIPQGDAATVAAGSTTTLAPGAAATVVNSGTSGAAIFDFAIPEGQPGLDGVGAPVYGQVSKMTSGTITVGTAGVYQSTGLTAVLDADNAGISLGTVDAFAIKNTSGAPRRLKFVATYDAFVTGPATNLGLALALNGVFQPNTECRATTSASGALAKLHTAWIIEIDDGDEVAMLVANHTNTTQIDFQRGRIVATSVAGFGPIGPTGPIGPIGPDGVVIYDDANNILSHQVFS